MGVWALAGVVVALLAIGAAGAVWVLEIVRIVAQDADDE